MLYKTKNSVCLGGLAVCNKLTKVLVVTAISVIAANGVGATGRVVTIGELVAGNVIPWRGMGAQSMRFQCLWLQSEVNAAGYINEVEFRRHSGSTNGAFNNCRVYFCHTNKTELEVTFDNNYAGNTPVQVMNALSFILRGSDWLAVAVTPAKFYFDNVNNLLMEIRWHGDSGEDFYCYRYNAPPRRLYAHNHNASYGTLLSQGQYIRLHLGTMPGVDPTSFGKVKALYRSSKKYK
jgi:hypothetical protein